MTDIPFSLVASLREGVQATQAEADIWTVLPATVARAEYDSLGPAYDRLVRGRLYNRLVWGARIADWTAYAQEAADASAHNGAMLDVACGSLTFTADVYARIQRPVVLLDRSITMLRMARQRLQKRGGNPQCTLLVADAGDLPFRGGAFDTIACHGALHHFPDLESTVKQMAGCLARDGHLYLTSLVDADRWIGRCWMQLLQRTHHFATIRTADEFVSTVREVTRRSLDVVLQGNVVYVHLPQNPAQA